MVQYPATLDWTGARSEPVWQSIRTSAASIRFIMTHLGQQIVKKLSSAY